MMYINANITHSTVFVFLTYYVLSLFINGRLSIVYTTRSNSVRRLLHLTMGFLLPVVLVYYERYVSAL